MDRTYKTTPEGIFESYFSLFFCQTPRPSLLTPAPLHLHDVTPCRFTIELQPLCSLLIFSP